MEAQADEFEDEDWSLDEPPESDGEGNLTFLYYDPNAEYMEEEAQYIYAYNSAYKDVRRELQAHRKGRQFFKKGNSRKRKGVIKGKKGKSRPSHHGDRGSIEDLKSRTRPGRWAAPENLQAPLQLATVVSRKKAEQCWISTRSPRRDLSLSGHALRADGAEILISSAVLSILQQDWELSPALKGGMMSVIFIGVFFGNLIGGPAADTYGRRVSVLMAYFGLVNHLFWLKLSKMALASARPTSMLLARFFFGLCYGFGMGPSLTLQVEICPKAWRGHMVNVNNFFFTLGEIYAAWLLWAFLKDLKQSSEEDLAAVHSQIISVSFGTIKTGYSSQESWRYVTALAVSPALLILPFAVTGAQPSVQIKAINKPVRMERRSFFRPADFNRTMSPVSDSEREVFADAPRMAARSVALIAKKRQAHPEVQPARHGRIDRIVLSLLGLESGESHILVEEGLFKCAVMLVRLELDSNP
eukprot:g30012.t1